MYKLLRSLFCFLCLIPATRLQAQFNIPQNSNWVMSNYSGLDFSTPQPTVTTSEISNIECSAAVSSAAGDLLFYTDGKTLWTAAHVVMPNGSQINGPSFDNTSITQGALIVPDPANAARYYVFSLQQQLYLNVVDMNLNNGQGNVVTNYPMRGIICTDTFAEKMVAIKGCNNNVWVLLKKHNVNEYAAFEVSVNGVDTVPVLSLGGAGIPSAYNQGEMKASPDGTKIAAASSNTYLELSDFDNASGIVYNTRIIDSLGHSYGCAFSKDGSKLYIRSNFTSQLLQYDLANHDVKTAIASSQMVSHIKLAPNGKIYLVSMKSDFGGNGDSYLACINQPDIAGSGCMFQDSVSGMAFPAHGTYAGLVSNLPNEVVVASPEGSGVTNRLLLDTSFCLAQPFTALTLNAFPTFTNYTWDDGSTGLTRTVTYGGTYWVRYETDCGRRTDTFRINSNGISGLQIQYNAPVLSVPGGYASYQWYQDGQLLNGETGPMLTATDTGMYSIRVTSNGGGCTDSAFYHVTGGITGIGSYEKTPEIRIYPNPVKDILRVQSDIPVLLQLTDLQGRMLSESRDKKLGTERLAAGVYLLQVRNARSGMLIRTFKIVK